MKENIVNNIVDCMAIYNNNSDLQRIQTEHRLKLAQFWNIKEGSKILEIGCGQGDTTAALAYLVGESGFVHGVDIASPNYGAPITLAEAADALKKSKLGSRIKMDFEVDVLSPSIDFPENSFDMIVLSHCSWYFKSFEELAKVFEKARKWGKRLCFAEWDSRVKTIEQMPHFLAVLIQAQYECFKANSLSNVRTLFSASDIKILAENAGWKIISEESIFSPELQDGKWETDITLNDYNLELDEITEMPLKLKSLIKSEVYLLEESIKNNGVKPMSTYALIAE